MQAAYCVLRDREAGSLRLQEKGFVLVEDDLPVSRVDLSIILSSDIRAQIYAQAQPKSC